MISLVGLYLSYKGLDSKGFPAMYQNKLKGYHSLVYR